MPPNGKKQTPKKKAAATEVTKKKTNKKAATKSSAGKTDTAPKVTKKKSVSIKKASPKKSVKNKSATLTGLKVTPEERWKMVAVAAYHRAEKRGFATGHELEDWTAAEQEIDAILHGS